MTWWGWFGVEIVCEGCGRDVRREKNLTWNKQWVIPKNRVRIGR